MSLLPRAASVFGFVLVLHIADANAASETLLNVGKVPLGSYATLYGTTAQG